MKSVIKKLFCALKREQYLPKFIDRGLKVGSHFCKMGGVIIDPSHCFHISIGNHVTLAPRVHILAHDASTQMFLGKTKVQNVTIGNYVFVGASTTILPGVTIGDRVIIGAGSIVSKDIPSNSVAVGNPAKVICSVDDYLAKEKNAMTASNVFNGFDPDTDVIMRNHIVDVASQCGKIFIG